jgi:hypothetical protein
LRLNHGDIHRYEPKVNTFQKIKFDTYDLKLELARTFAAIEKKLKDKELSIEDIRKRMEEVKRTGGDTISYEIELHKRYAIPFTCVVFALIGVPLSSMFFIIQSSGRANVNTTGFFPAAVQQVGASGAFLGYMEIIVEIDDTIGTVMDAIPAPVAFLGVDNNQPVFSFVESALNRTGRDTRALSQCMHRRGTKSSSPSTSTL